MADSREKRAILGKLEADDPAWAASLDQPLKDARIRVALRRRSITSESEL